MGVDVEPNAFAGRNGLVLEVCTTSRRGKAPAHCGAAALLPTQPRALLASASVLARTVSLRGAVADVVSGLTDPHRRSLQNRHGLGHLPRRTPTSRITRGPAARGSRAQAARVAWGRGQFAVCRADDSLG